MATGTTTTVTRGQLNPINTTHYSHIAFVGHGPGQPDTTGRPKTINQQLHSGRVTSL